MRTGADTRYEDKFRIPLNRRTAERRVLADRRRGTERRHHTTAE